MTLPTLTVAEENRILQLRREGMRISDIVIALRVFDGRFVTYHMVRKCLHQHGVQIGYRPAYVLGRTPKPLSLVSAHSRPDSLPVGSVNHHGERP
jgi:hypothetical protein